MVRRTAEIFLFDADDYECLFAKYNINGFWTEEHLAQDQKVKAAMMELNIPIPAWMNDIKIGVPARNINHRRMSNNSIVFTEKPSEDFLHLVFQLIQLDAEPGFVNLEEMSRRRENAQGVNP